MGEDLAVLRWIENTLHHRFTLTPAVITQSSDRTPFRWPIFAARLETQATYFNWKKKYDRLLPNEMRRLKQLEDENNKLRKGLLSRSGIMVWRANRSVPPRGL